MGKRITYKEIKKQIREMGYTLLTKEEEYKNTKTKLLVKCSKGHEFETRYYDLKNRNKCLICSGDRIDKKAEIGKKYNMWTILGFEEHLPNKQLTAICKCDCGTIKKIRYQNLKKGLSKNCGCIRKKKISEMMSIESIVGEKYGRLTVVEEIGKNKYGKTICKCKCDCGNTAIVLSNSLRSGSTLSCGCLMSKYPSIIQNELLNLGYNSVKEKHINLKNELINYIRFDVYVPSLNLAIEYDGEGHFIPTDYAGRGMDFSIEQLKQTQLRDRIKDKYCIKNGIYLLRIPYTEKNNIKNILKETINIITESPTTTERKDVLINKTM